MGGPGPLAALLGSRTGCPHVLGKWVLRTSKSTQSYPDGQLRRPELRGGRMQRSGTPCVFAPGHRGEHRTQDGRSWT